MWPFTRTTALPQEQLDRIRRKCGIAAGTLQQCLAANPDNPSVCNSLEAQVVYCYAEVVCPQLAMEHQRCFTRVVNSKGREPLSTCDKHVEAMRKCLRRYGLHPFSKSGSLLKSASKRGKQTT